MMNSTSIDIIMADDHEIFRDGFAVMFRRITDIRLVADARNGEQLLSLVETHQPDVVLVDIEMPGMDGIAVTRILRSRYPGIGIIALTSYDSDVLIVDMIKAGAQGYLLKNSHKHIILEAIRTVYRNEHYYCPQIARRLSRLISTSQFDPHNPSSDKVLFSQREQEIMRLICSERSNKEISALLYLSIRTIEGYRLRIMEKTGARGVAGLVVYAIRNGIFKV